MQELIQEMLKMQDAMNKKVDADWMKKNREWYRAIWIECAELMEHYGSWKWWKKENADLGQVLLELVDIWHFGLSSEINDCKTIEAATHNVISSWEGGQTNYDFYTSVEKLASVALLERRFSITAFRCAVSSVGFNFNDIYKGYIAKNVLNHFRQENGYKEGLLEIANHGLNTGDKVIHTATSASGGLEDEKMYAKKSIKMT